MGIISLLKGSSPKPASLSEEAIDKMLVDPWVQSEERAWYMGRRAMVFAFAGLGVIVALLAGFIGQPPRSEAETWWATIIAAVALVILGYSTFPYFAARRAFLERRRMMAKARAAIALRDMTLTDEIPLKDLFRYNRRQLDAYQQDSRNQQRTAFRHAQFASLAGLVVLVIGIAVSLKEAPGSEKYVVAGLSGLGAALSGYIANTFVQSARRANQQLNLYYQEPHMMGRLIVAERLAKKMHENDETEMDKSMIVQALGWPLPGIDGIENNRISNSEGQQQ